MISEIEFDDQPWTGRYLGDTAVLNAVRVDADSYLVRRNADAETRDRAALVVSELASNAVHASPGEWFDVELARVAPDTLRITVWNRASETSIPARHAWGPDDVLSVHGRGLMIVDAICRRVVVDTSPDSVIRVTAEMPARFG